MRDWSRRAALAGLGASLGGAALGAHAASRHAPLRFIDVHHHYGSQAFADFNKRFGGATTFPWDIDSDLKDMDASHAALSILSGFTPSAGGTAADRAALSRGENETGAQLVRDHPGRLALFATLPLPDVDACLKEAAYALDTLGAVGLAVYTDAADKWLGDPSFDPLYAELDRRKAVVFVHPHSPPCCVNLTPHVPDTFIEYGTASSRAIASLIAGGTTQRFPNIRWIFSHGGGTIPFLIERFLAGTEAELVPGIVTHGQKSKPAVAPPATFLGELRKMYFDTAQMANPVALRALKSVVGVSQIVYGTDVWFRSGQESTSGVIGSKVFTPAELQAVASGNILRLIPSLASKMKAT